METILWWAGGGALVFLILFLLTRAAIKTYFREKRAHLRALLDADKTNEE